MAQTGWGKHKNKLWDRAYARVWKPNQTVLCSCARVNTAFNDGWCGSLLTKARLG